METHRIDFRQLQMGNIGKNLCPFWLAFLTWSSCVVFGSLVVFRNFTLHFQWPWPFLKITGSGGRMSTFVSVVKFDVRKFVRQVSQVYQCIEFKRFASLVPFADKFRLERIIVGAAKNMELQVSGMLPCCSVLRQYWVHKQANWCLYINVCDFSLFFSVMCLSWIYVLCL